ncbi:divergent PAP2 family protein [Verrucomicrobiota bacterium]
MIDNSVLDIFRNEFFWAAFCAWTAAQFTKMLCGFFKTKRFNFSYIVRLGGMPSAHSALVSALAASVGLSVGFVGPVFAITLALALIVMFDAATVRRAAGKQAQLLNEMVEEFFKEHRFSEKKLAELLGHTRLEVFLGMIMGVLVALLVHSFAVLY